VSERAAATARAGLTGFRPFGEHFEEHSELLEKIDAAAALPSGARAAELAQAHVARGAIAADRDATQADETSGGESRSNAAFFGMSRAFAALSGAMLWAMLPGGGGQRTVAAESASEGGADAGTPTRKRESTLATASLAPSAGALATGSTLAVASLALALRRPGSAAGRFALLGRRAASSSTGARGVVRNPTRSASTQVARDVKTTATASSFATTAPKSTAGSPKQCIDATTVLPAAAASKVLPTAESTDEELLAAVRAGTLAPHRLEEVCSPDLERAVRIRRAVLALSPTVADSALTDMPYESYDYERVVGACCENVIGYVPLPVGSVGPMLIDGQNVVVPMATTEGCLVASTHRGAKAISESGGATTTVVGDAMSRAPVIRCASAAEAARISLWVQDAENILTIRAAFEGTTRFGKLLSVTPTVAGKNLYLRFKASSGDAMGMNMVSKGVEAALGHIGESLGIDLDVLALSGNLCTDKKPSAINWIDGRGKSVIAEAVVKADIVRTVLKTTVDDLVQLNIAKNLVGSAMAGSVGGQNAHAANIVAAVFLAAGQDPAQVVESSTCITLMEKTEDGDLHISVSMPSIEVGTVGGGTGLPAQAASLELMGVRGASETGAPGDNARRLAQIIASAVMAGELSLMSALSAGHLMTAHLKYNRKASN
jgi:hydroxymethylglutaryl-CoA reductase (NADPH)